MTQDDESTTLGRAFSPALSTASAEALRALTAELITLQREGADPVELAMACDEAVEGLGRDDQALVVAARVLTDLAKQGCSLSITDDDNIFVEGAIPDTDDDPIRALKTLRRQQLLVERDMQLRQLPVRQFVHQMEQRRVHQRPGQSPQFTSIFSLMRDGRELAASLQRWRDEGAAPEALKQVISPYLQIIDEDERCELTGLELRSVWRYFRHTWATSYKSTPGRSMLVLIRDAAAQYHPVIGIAAVSSAAVQIRQRDLWIGWHPECAPGEEASAEAHRLEVSEALAQWAQRVVDEQIDELHVEDLLAARLITPQELRAPGELVIARLSEYSAQQRTIHQRLSNARQHKPSAADMNDPEHWRRQAELPLYKSKRAATLAELLELRAALLSAFEGPPTAAGLARLLESAQGQQRFRRIMRRAKAARVGIAMADINVCGAAPPYTELIGGKLVCMLLTSPELVDAYKERYREASSVIASSMAGRPVRRDAELVLLTTTSLYGHSSQYNRISVPTDTIPDSSNHTIRYEQLGETEGYGTDQFGPDTLEAMTQLIEQRSGVQRVNNVFGEGVNPRLRKLREGLEAIGLSADAYLMHGNARGLYGVALAENFREYLLGLDETPRYHIPPGGDSRAATEAIASWWRERWLAMRARPEILARVAQHTLVRPIQHGARVVLPPMEREQLRLL